MKIINLLIIAVIPIMFCSCWLLEKKVLYKTSWYVECDSSCAEARLVGTLTIDSTWKQMPFELSLCRGTDTMILSRLTGRLIGGAYGGWSSGAVHHYDDFSGNTHRFCNAGFSIDSSRVDSGVSLVYNATWGISRGKMTSISRHVFVPFNSEKVDTFLEHCKLVVSLRKKK